jgi:hypothetical protein
MLTGARSLCREHLKKLIADFVPLHKRLMFLNQLIHGGYLVGVL